MAKINVKQKGNAHERQIAIEFRKIDPTAMRNCNEAQIASVDINTKLPLAIQCKHLKRWSMTPHAIYTQACEGALKEDDCPIGIVKINNKTPQLVIISLEHFLDLMKALYGDSTENFNSFIQCKSWLSLPEAPPTS